MIIKNKKGLTLVELLVCVVLISIISAMMYKLLSNINSKRKTATNLGNAIVKSGEATIKLEDLIKDSDIYSIVYSSNKIDFYERNNTYPVATITFSSDEKKSTISIADPNDSTNKSAYSFNNTTITACAQYDDYAIDIYLIIKKSNTNDIYTTVEFPYYNENRISPQNFIKCGEEK